MKNGKTLHYKLSEPYHLHLGYLSRAELALVAQGYGVHSAVCFTTRTAEASMLAGELGINMAAALPLGAVAGLGLGYLIVWHLDNDLFQVPLVVGWRTYAIAISTVLAAATLSFALAARRLRSIDIPAALRIGATASAETICRNWRESERKGSARQKPSPSGNGVFDWLLGPQPPTPIVPPRITAGCGPPVR